MKIAVTGRGGVGKTTLVAGLVKYFVNFVKNLPIFKLIQ